MLLKHLTEATEKSLDKEAQELVQKVDNPNAIKAAANYLQKVLAKLKPQQEPQQPPEEQTDQKPVTEGISDDKDYVMAAIAELANSGNQSELNAVVSFLRRAEITELSNSAITANISQGVQGGLDKKLAELVISVDAPFDQKEKFLQTLATQKGYWNGADLVNNKSGNVYEKIKSVPILKDIYMDIALKFRGAMGYGPDQGPGEFLLALTGKGVDLADKSDLILINGQGVEVKADNGGVATRSGKVSRAGGRLYATSGYGNGSSARIVMYKKMIELGVPESALAVYGWPKKSAATDKIPLGGLNFNTRGVANLNTLFKQHLDSAGVREVIAGALKGLYTELPEDLANKFLDNVVDGNQIVDEPTLNKEFIALGQDYYKIKEGHDYVMVFNTKTGGYITIGDGDDARALLDSGDLAHTGGFDLFDDRSKGTPQLVTNV